MESTLARSKALEAFKQDVLRFSAGEEPSAIEILGYAPRVKVERVLIQLLNAEPELSDPLGQGPWHVRVLRLHGRGDRGHADRPADLRLFLVLPLARRGGGVEGLLRIPRPDPRRP